MSCEIDHAEILSTMSIAVVHFGQRKQAGWAAEKAMTAGA
jgi:hypothetical protein